MVSVKFLKIEYFRTTHWVFFVFFQDNDISLFDEEFLIVKKEPLHRIKRQLNLLTTTTESSGMPTGKLFLF